MCKVRRCWPYGRKRATRHERRCTPLVRSVWGARRRVFVGAWVESGRVSDTGRDVGGARRGLFVEATGRAAGDERRAEVCASD